MIPKVELADEPDRMNNPEQTVEPMTEQTDDSSVVELAVAAIPNSVAALTGRQPTNIVTDFRSLLLSGTPLLDVRAPVEFARGSFPNSVNHPLLMDDERHQVGIRYKKNGQTAAIGLAAALIDDAERERRPCLPTVHPGVFRSAREFA